MNPDSARREYLESRIISSTPEGLVEIIYEEALASTRKAVTCLRNGDIPGRAEAVSTAQGLIGELAASLDESKAGDVARELRALYQRISVVLARAHVSQNVHDLESAEKSLLILLEWWRKLTGHTSPEFTNSFGLDAGSTFGAGKTVSSGLARF